MQCLDLVMQADAKPVLPGQPRITVIVSPRGAAPPSAVVRKRMGESLRAARANPFYFALVLPALAQRAAYTAIQWISGGGQPGHYTSAFESFDHAQAWVERETKRLRPELREAYVRAQQSLARQSAGSA